MNILIKDKIYNVRFSRDGTTTFADLNTVEDGVEIPTNLVGTALLGKKDRFEKSKGRKIALAKLLVRMQQISAGDITPEFILSKEDKKYIWEQYFKEHRIK